MAGYGRDKNMRDYMFMRNMYYRTRRREILITARPSTLPLLLVAKMWRIEQ